MKKLLCFFGLACILSSCQNDSQDVPGQTPTFGQVGQNGQRPNSSIPWNRSQAWENTGQLGAMPAMSGIGGTEDTGGSSGVMGGAVGR
jgi:hypothetical protein